MKMTKSTAKRPTKKRQADSLERIVRQHWTTLLCAIQCGAFWEDALAKEYRESDCKALPRSAKRTAAKYRRLHKRLVLAEQKGQ